MNTNGRLENPRPMALLDSRGGWAPFTPRTQLVKRLVELHNEQILEGARSLSNDEILRQLEDERAGRD